jgi:hypothetical protein
VLLVQLRQLATEARPPARSERGGEIRERGADAIGRFVEDHGGALVAQRADQLLARAGLARGEAEEQEAIARQPRADERGQRRRRSRDDLDLRTACHGGGHGARARIGDAGHAGLADHGHALTGRERGDQLLRPHGLVALEQRHDPPAGIDRAMEIRVREQRLRGARVLGGDHVGLAQHARGAEREILEVADRRAHDEQRAAVTQDHSRVIASMSTALPSSASRYFFSRSSMRFSSWRARSRLTL